MPDWVNYRAIHITVRVVTGTYLIALVGWTLYKYLKERTRNRPEDNFKKLEGGDVHTPDESDLTLSGDEEDDDDDNDDDDDFSELSAYYNDNQISDDEIESHNNVLDIEDIKGMQSGEIDPSAEVTPKVIVKRRRRSHIKDNSAVLNYDKFVEEQLTDRLRGDLTKQGYKLVGTHSAVKMCRWTKNSMRGRGGCYKHTFYGINSYQCMEMTPNMACASKCTFCWRHHKNPVGTEWKWKMDPPQMIIEQGLSNHLNMINQFKGVPGVTVERFTEALNVRHCALSLVGEPIFYPRINELLEMLHARRISTFLVTNAQFPDAMRHLVPVTQLYVSIDAPNKEALKKIDRPLYKDFWQRYIECLEIISEKKQRTVFRLTLVLKANMEDYEGYARLIEIGQPNFIEIKGVTYCGTSKAIKLTMESVPWHEQVVEFGKQLITHLPKDKYELACEHSASNCVLIADKKFKINGKWHTWIDYDRYFELIDLQTSNQSRDEFESLDYAAETPSWAIFGSDEGGFDPDHTRWIRKEHKLKLLKERMEASQNCCSSQGDNCYKNDLPQTNDAIAIEQNS